MLICPAHAKSVRCTSYTHSEDKRWGILNCMGGRLDESQCAADLSLYPLGTVLVIRPPSGQPMTRTVTDCGSAVQGWHVDIYWSNVEKMRHFGTQFCVVTVKAVPLKKRCSRIKVDTSANLHLPPPRRMASVARK